MKLTVWTKWNTTTANVDSGRPKCVFIGKSEILPRKGEMIVVREGFACEIVTDVIIDLTTKEAEIKIDTADPRNEYGNCLVKGAESTPEPQPSDSRRKP